MSDQDAMLTSPYSESDTLDQKSANRYQSDKKPKHSKSKRRYSTSRSSRSSSSSFSDDEPPKR